MVKVTADIDDVFITPPLRVLIAYPKRTHINAFSPLRIPEEAIIQGRLMTYPIPTSIVPSGDIVGREPTNLAELSAHVHVDAIYIHHDGVHRLTGANVAQIAPVPPIPTPQSEGATHVHVAPVGINRVDSAIGGVWAAHRLPTAAIPLGNVIRRDAAGAVELTPHVDLVSTDVLDGMDRVVKAAEEVVAAQSPQATVLVGGHGAAHSKTSRCRRICIPRIGHSVLVNLVAAPTACDVNVRAICGNATAFIGSSPTICVLGGPVGIHGRVRVPVHVNVVISPGQGAAGEGGGAGAVHGHGVGGEIIDEQSVQDGLFGRVVVAAHTGVVQVDGVGRIPQGQLF